MHHFRLEKIAEQMNMNLHEWRILLPIAVKPYDFSPTYDSTIEALNLRVNTTKNRRSPAVKALLSLQI